VYPLPAGVPGILTASGEGDWLDLARLARGSHGRNVNEQYKMVGITDMIAQQNASELP